MPIQFGDIKGRDDVEICSAGQFRVQVVARSGLALFAEGSVGHRGVRRMTAHPAAGFDPVLHSVTAHLAALDAAEAHEELITARVEEIIVKELTPMTLAMMSEALGDVLVAGNPEGEDLLHDFQRGRITLFAVGIGAAIEVYWEKWARAKAEKELAGDASCLHVAKLTEM